MRQELNYEIYKKAKRNFEREQKRAERENERLNRAMDKKKSVQLWVRGTSFFTYFMLILIALSLFLGKLF